jgi:hypothetical protein
VVRDSILDDNGINGLSLVGGPTSNLVVDQVTVDASFNDAVLLSDFGGCVTLSDTSLIASRRFGLVVENSPSVLAERSTIHASGNNAIIANGVESLSVVKSTLTDNGGHAGDSVISSSMSGALVSVAHSMIVQNGALGPVISVPNGLLAIVDAPRIDQRGSTRVIDTVDIGAVDIGAVEVAGPVVTPTAPQRFADGRIQSCQRTHCGTRRPRQDLPLYRSGHPPDRRRRRLRTHVIIGCHSVSDTR